MKIRDIKSARALLAAFGLLALSLPAYAQQAAPTSAVQTNRQSDERPAKNRMPRTGLMSSEEKVVRDVYARLMRYHTAARDEEAATTGVSYRPEDYVVFELRNIHSGAIEEIAARPLAQLVTGATEEALRVTAHHLQYGNGPKHSFYDVAWSSSPSTAPYNDRLTVTEMLASGGDRLVDIARYTSFEVTIRLAGKERTYRAIALHHNGADSTGKPGAEILDNVAGEMNAVLADESPRVRSPWKTYVKSGLYLAVASYIQKAERGGRPLIPADAPIGYLPGDGLSPMKVANGMSLAVSCTTVEITNISPPTLNVSTGDTASAHTLTVDFTPAGTSASISFQSSFIHNHGGTSQASLTVPSVNGTSPVTTTVKAGAASSSGAFSVQPAADGNLSPKETRVIVPPQVLLKMMNREAGGLDNPAPPMPLLGWTMRNRFNDKTYFQDQTTYEAAISASAAQSNLANGKQPELDAAAGVFDGYLDPSSGCQGFWSPTDGQWVTINQALQHPTTRLPTGVGEPFCYNGNCNITQYVYFSRVGFNNRPGRQNAPAFVFVRKRSSADFAVVKVD